MENVIIIGSGPAGLTAALYTARANLNPLVITGQELGGQIATTTEVENFPGFPEGLTGPQLTELMQKQAERFGARIEFDSITSVDLTRRPFRLAGNNAEYEAKIAHRRHRRQPAQAGRAGRKRTDRARRVVLRHVRRIFLPRQGADGRRRRRQRLARRLVPDQVCRQSADRPSPR